MELSTELKLNRSQEVNKRINKLKSNFRLLKNWKITHYNDGRYYAQCDWNKDKRIGIIYEYADNFDLEPDDYILHELLHLCFVELRKGRKKDGTRGLREREKEEIFVQDLCKLIYK